MYWCTMLTKKMSYIEIALFYSRAPPPEAASFETMSYRGRGRGGFNNNNNSNRNASQQFGAEQPSTEVEIFGWNGSTPGECIAFISRKCKISVKNYTVNNVNGALRGFVRSDSEANDLLQWSGVRFAGNPLKISKVSNGGFGNGNQVSPGPGENTIDTLTMFLKSRYDPQNMLLNLSAVQQDPTLSAKGFFGTISTSSKFFPALMKIASDLKLNVTSADLSNNNLSDLTTVSTLAQTFPSLQNLSLQNNKFTRIKAFDIWKKKLNFLRELILTGNPMVNTNDATTALNIKLELLKVFPRLVVLNGEIVRNEQALISNLSFLFKDPVPMFFQDSEIQNLSTNFITNFYNLWDSNRADLMVLYQAESQFSLQVDSTLPHTLDNKPQPDFSYYLPLSRNLTRVSSVKARMTRVSKGQEQIYKTFTQLPGTRHDLMLKPDNYCMESYRLAPLGAICITLHGSFEETAQPTNLEHMNQLSGMGRNKYAYLQKLKSVLGSKSFDRTFIVIPGPNAGMIVASDLLCIRAEADADAFRPSAVPVAIPTPTPSPAPVNPVAGNFGTPGNQSQFNTPPPQMPSPTAADLPAEVKAGLNPMQQEMLVKVLLETKLTIQYGVMLCQQSNWDYQQCIINFKNSAASLPRDAFTA